MNQSISIHYDSSTSAGVGSVKEQLRFTDEQFIWRFSPNQTDPELLEAISVGREPLLQNILEKIADAATSSATHHVLLYGPRGIGKSHFISLLHHRLLIDKKLSEAVHIAHLHEDETTTSMVQLLVRIYRSLCKAYPDAYSADWLDELLNQPPDEITGVLTRRLAARFEKRKLVILVENLNLLFENLGTDGQHELRTFLQEYPFACVIATSQQLFKAVTDRSEPCFGFFQQIQLKPLSLQDAQTLLAKIASGKGQDDLAAFLNTPDGRGRVRAIHDLAGGNHRVYIVLSGFITRESLDQLVAPFQKMADDLTPYYQERLRWISPLQRQIVELLCREHRTLNPKEIARRLLGDQNSIGKQVRELTNIGYLTSTKRGRETFYELSEPLMRLAYEVKEQSLLEMLIEFLRIWYRPDQMQQLRNGGLSPSTQAYVDAPYERSQTHPEPRLKLLQEELENAAAEGRSHELATLQRWDEAFAAIRDAFAHSSGLANDLGDVSAMFSLIFRLSEDADRLHWRISTLVDLYQQAAEEQGFRRQDQETQRRRSGKGHTDDATQQNALGTSRHSVRPATNPLSHLANGLVKSLSMIDTTRVTPMVLEGYVASVEQRVVHIPEFEIPLRLFRYGVRYLISQKESEFVELIQPERRILRQALGLEPESPKH